MAGDWIKMRSNLWDDPRVARIVDATDSSEAAVVGALYWLWATADQHTEDGVLIGMSLRALDRKTGVQGFGAALVSVGWLEDGAEGVRVVRFEEHNGRSAKRRCSESVRKMSARDADKVQTQSVHEEDEPQTICAPREREEEREEEPPLPPVPGGELPSASPSNKRERKPRISLKTFLDRCQQAGEKAVSGYAPLLEYVEATALPMEFVQLAWDHFKREHLPNGANQARLQADWRKHFLAYVEKGYYRLWYAKPDGGYELTTVGIQAQRLHAAGGEHAA